MRAHMARSPELRFDWIQQDDTKQARLSREAEAALSLEWVGSNQQLLHQLQDTLAAIATSLGADIPRVVAPEKFLAHAPTKEQDATIAQHLQDSYVQAALRLQDALMGVTIAESGERMVDLPNLFLQHNLPISLSTLPFHMACGDWGGKPRVFWVREQVAHKVLRVAQALQQQGFMIHLEDCFRPLGVQEGLFKRRVQLILSEHPEWITQWDKVWQEARSKTAISPWMAGHKSGAAVDITLRTLEGASLPLGNAYPEGGPKVALVYPYVTQAEWSTRQLFSVSMELAGLRLYPYENWHASWGDLSAAIVQGSTTEAQSNYVTQYGPVKGFDPQTGEIIPYTQDEYFNPFFTKEELLQTIVER